MISLFWSRSNESIFCKIFISGIDEKRSNYDRIRKRGESLSGERGACVCVSLRFCMHIFSAHKNQLDLAIARPWLANCLCNNNKQNCKNKNQTDRPRDRREFKYGYIVRARNESESRFVLRARGINIWLHTVVQNSQESGRKYWATGLPVRSFARKGRSFACSTLLASLASSAHSFAHSLHCAYSFTHALPNWGYSEWLMLGYQPVLNHSGLAQPKFITIKI